jgi:hypothetical protein
MATIAQIKNNDSAVKRLARALDAVSWVAATVEGPDHPRWQEYKAARRAYRIALLTPLALRSDRAFRMWLATPGRSPFKDLNRRSNTNALRRAVTAAKRALERANLKGTMREQVEAEAALVAARDSLEIYQRDPTTLTPAELDHVIGAL